MLTKEEMLQVNVSNREGIISAIKEEIVGPKMDFSSRTLLDDKITKSDLQNEYTNFYYLDNDSLQEKDLDSTCDYIKKFIKKI